MIVVGEQITKCLPRLRFPRFVPPTFVETIASKEISCQENNIYIFASILSILFKEFVRKKRDSEQQIFNDLNL